MNKRERRSWCWWMESKGVREEKDEKDEELQERTQAAARTCRISNSAPGLPDSGERSPCFIECEAQMSLLFLFVRTNTADVGVL